MFGCSPGTACTESCWHPAARSRACVCLCRGAELVPVQLNSSVGWGWRHLQSWLSEHCMCWRLAVRFCSAVSAQGFLAVLYCSMTRSAAITLVLETRASSWPWSTAALMYKMDKLFRYWNDLDMVMGWIRFPEPMCLLIRWLMSESLLE